MTGHVFIKMVMEKKWRQEGGQTQVTAAEVRAEGMMPTGGEIVFCW